MKCQLSRATYSGSNRRTSRPFGCRDLFTAFASLLCRSLRLRSVRCAGLLLVSLAVAVALLLHLSDRLASTSDARFALRLSVSRFLNVGDEQAADVDLSQVPEKAENAQQYMYVSLAAHASRFEPIDSPTAAAANAHVFAVHVDPRQPTADVLHVVGIALARNRPPWWPPAAARLYCHFWFPPPSHAKLFQQSLDDTRGNYSPIAQTSRAEAIAEADADDDDDANDVLATVSLVPFTAAAIVTHVLQYYHEKCAPLRSRGLHMFSSL